MLKPETIALIKGKNFATFTTLMKDGHPATQVMWVDCDDDCVLINTEVHRFKYKHVLRDPRVTVTVWNNESPYTYVEIRGVVSDMIEGPRAREHIDELSMCYYGRPYDPAIIQSERVLLRIRPLKDLV